MREIKFRAWHPLTKVMINWTMLNRLMDGMNIATYEGMNNAMIRDGSGNTEMRSTIFSNTNIFKLDNLTLLQYTGLKDKNGVEIYEGDVVNLYRPFVVQWEENDDIDYSFVGFGLNPSYQHKYEIIGNIYENPELLTVKGK